MDTTEQKLMVALAFKKLVKDNIIIINSKIVWRSLILFIFNWQHNYMYVVMCSNVWSLHYNSQGWTPSINILDFKLTWKTKFINGRECIQCSWFPSIIRVCLCGTKFIMGKVIILLLTFDILQWNLFCSM